MDPRTKKSFQEELDGIHISLFGRTPNQKKRRKYLIATLTAVALTVIASTAFLHSFISQRNSLTPIEAYSSLYEAPNVSLAYRSEVANINAAYTALELYSQEKYIASLSFFEKAYSSNPEQYGLQLYSSIALIEVGNTEKAISQLKNLILKKTPFDDSARWYLAMAYLKEGRKNHACQMLGYLHKHGQRYRKPAKQALKRLN